ncbi:MAG TPA: YdeI/OmpD-associated family protein [Vicinamibacterales bacterium]|nr:YdeI/OmpD-associated family protein [Vicinamibacterales bacterium]
MPKTDPRIDAYIKKARPFAQPIMTHLRKIVHRAVPDVEETIKWSVPHFAYKGMFCGFAAFNEHVGFGFWKAALLKDHLPGIGGSMAGQFGKITSLKDLPGDRELTRILKAAKKLNDDEVKAPPMRKGPRPELKAPADLLAALARNKKAKATFDNFSPAQRREYISWVIEAKQAATREKRIKTAVEWMAEGKIRNWKYVR